MILLLLPAGLRRVCPVSRGEGIEFLMKIEVVQSCKRYGDLLAVDHIRSRWAGGEIVGYLGPNGAGKSTTVKMLTGVMPPSEGRILIDGLDLRENALAIKQSASAMCRRAAVSTRA